MSKCDNGAFCCLKAVILNDAYTKATQRLRGGYTSCTVAYAKTVYSILPRSSSKSCVCSGGPQSWGALCMGGRSGKQLQSQNSADAGSYNRTKLAKYILCRYAFSMLVTLLALQGYRSFVCHHFTDKNSAFVLHTFAKLACQSQALV